MRRDAAELRSHIDEAKACIDGAARCYLDGMDHMQLTNSHTPGLGTGPNDAAISARESKAWTPTRLTIKPARSRVTAT